MISSRPLCCNNNGLLLFSPLQPYAQTCKMQAIDDDTKVKLRSRSRSGQKKLQVCAASPFTVAEQAKKDLYGVLGVESGASREQIKACYRRLARKLHPDSATSTASSAADFMALHAAYSVLSDPESRAKYDRSVASVFVLRPVQGGTTAHVGRRNWESDQCW